MNTSFAHFVLTRFNIRLSAGSVLPDEEWLRARLELFKRFPLSSIKSQTIRDFRWLVFIDEGSPTWLVTELDRALNDPRFLLIRSDAFRPAHAVSELLAQQSPPDYLMTTRLDNDDAVAKDFLEIVQHEFARQPFEFINPLDGAQLSLDAVYLKSHPASPFLTLVEELVRDSLPETVFAVEHESAYGRGPVKQVIGGPMWLQVIHERNLANRPRGIRVAPNRVLARFDVDVRVSDTSGVRRFPAQLGDVASLFVRMLIRPKTAVKAWRIVKARSLARLHWWMHAFERLGAAIRG